MLEPQDYVSEPAVGEDEAKYHALMSAQILSTHISNFPEIRKVVAEALGVEEDDLAESLAGIELTFDPDKVPGFDEEDYEEDEEDEDEPDVSDELTSGLLDDEDEEFAEDEDEDD